MIIGTYHLTKSKVSYIIERQPINHSRNLSKIFLIAPLRYAREVKRIRAQSAKEQKCRVLTSPRRTTTYNPKTNMVVVVVENVVVATSRTAISRIEVPRTTAQQFTLTA